MPKTVRISPNITNSFLSIKYDNYFL